MFATGSYSRLRVLPRRALQIVPATRTLRLVGDGEGVACERSPRRRYKGCGPHVLYLSPHYQPSQALDLNHIQLSSYAIVSVASE